MTVIRVLGAGILFLLFIAAAQAEPKSCTQAVEACTAARACDIGCKRTCVSRFNGCLKTGAFALNVPRLLLTNLKRN